MVFTLDADRYNDARVQSIENIAGNDYGLTLRMAPISGC
jgi:hypothetical protein